VFVFQRWRQATKAVETQELEAGTDCDSPSNQKVTASKEFSGPKEGRTGESGEKLAPGKMGARPYLCVESPRVVRGREVGEMIQIWQRSLLRTTASGSGSHCGRSAGQFIPVGRKAVKPLSFWSRLVKEAASDLPDFVGIQMGQQ
jgi:hypothetical protein